MKLKTFCYTFSFYNRQTGELIEEMTVWSLSDVNTYLGYFNATHHYPAPVLKFRCRDGIRFHFREVVDKDFPLDTPIKMGSMSMHLTLFNDRKGIYSVFSRFTIERVSE